MKKSALILLLVIVLTLTIALPAFADPDLPKGKACDHIGSGRSYGWWKAFYVGQGWGPTTPWIGRMQACLNHETPKTPNWAGN